MKVGLQINKFTWKGQPGSISEILGKVAEEADNAGFSSIWVMDHFFQIGHVGDRDEPMMEAYTTLGYLAGKTKKMMLGTMVTGVIYRQPALLIKAVTTLDVLSSGRAYFGIGAAWNKEECEGLGFEFPPVKERFETLEETLKLGLQMWSGEEKPFEGKYVNARQPINSPQSISRPHPKILIGGGGEKKTLKLVAQYANACNLFDGPELEHKLEVLKKHCKEVGRDYDEIEKTAMSWAGRTGHGIDSAEFLDECRKLKELGIEHIITSIPNISEIEPIKTFAEKVIPEAAKI